MSPQEMMVQILGDRSLSYGARGLAASVLAKPEFRTIEEMVAYAPSMDRAGIGRLIDELKHVGYAQLKPGPEGSEDMLWFDFEWTAPNLELAGGTGQAIAPAAAFDQFWALYPRRVSKRGAVKVFNRIVLKREATPEAIIAGARRYAAEMRGKEPKYIKHPTTWLRNGCWEDEPPVGPPGGMNAAMGRLAKAVIAAGGGTDG